MALTIEDGTGIDGADSFIDVTACAQFATDYFGSNLGHSTADKEAALRRAFVILSVQPWKAGLWPLFGGTIPAAVKNAQAAIARVEVQNPGTLSPVYDRSKAKVLTSVGNIGWTPKAGPSTVEAARPVVTMAMDFLKAADLLELTGGVAFLERG
jgi:hypothetical protein